MAFSTTKKDESALLGVFSLEEKENETIYDVIGRMETILSYCSRTGQHAGVVPFLETYYLVTKNVAERHLENNLYFKNFTKLEELDVFFASLFFNPAKDYFNGQLTSELWKTYFEYCSKKDGRPFLQMLLGINVHINADLVTSLSFLNYRERRDYLVINKILNETIPEVLTFLAFGKMDIIGFGGIFLKKIFRNEFRRVIVRWRTDAWKNAEYVKSDKEKLKNYQEQISEQTEDINRKLIALFDHPYRFRTLWNILQRIHKLQVRIRRH